jgi:hypothetical protein
MASPKSKTIGGARLSRGRSLCQRWTDSYGYLLSLAALQMLASIGLHEITPLHLLPHHGFHSTHAAEPTPFSIRGSYRTTKRGQFSVAKSHG